MNGIIYKVTNTVTDEIYIGATQNSIKDRKKDHLEKAYNGHGHYFHEAIKTYGPKVFVWKQIDTASNIDELAKKEIKCISEHSSNVEGYNSDKGGGFKKTVYQYNLDGSLANAYTDLESAANAIKTDKKAISKACWSVGQIRNGFYWSYDYKVPFLPNPDQRKKKVYQYDVGGKLVSEYESAAEAARVTLVLKDCITKCCRGERKSSGGFYWKYI